MVSRPTLYRVLDRWYPRLEHTLRLVAPVVMALAPVVMALAAYLLYRVTVKQEMILFVLNGGCLK